MATHERASRGARLLGAGAMNLRHRMPDVVYVSAVSSRSASGDPVFAARRRLAARVEFDAKRIRLADGTEAVSDATIYTHDAIKEGERCWLPGESSKDTEKAREVIRVQGADSFSSGRRLYQAEV